MTKNKLLEKNWQVVPIVGAHFGCSVKQKL